METSIYFLVNAAAGGQGGADVASALPHLLAKFGLTCAVRLIRNGSEVHNEAERALQSDFRTIVAAGGDGTVSAVASHLLGTDRCLGILPVGTFNYVARDWGIPLAAEDAVRVIAEGAERVVDVGEVNGRAFLNNAGLGGYAMIVRRRERVFNSWGRSRIAAYWVILRSLFDLRQSLTLKVTVDGEVWRYRTPMVFIAKSAYQLEQYSLAGSACVAQRKLVLYVAPDCNRWELMRLAVGLALGQLEPERDFALHCGSEILVETRKRNRHVVCDGELQRMRGPFRFRLRKDALRVLAPPAECAAPHVESSASDSATGEAGLP
ncbi:MAG: diacylglycerol kinase family protein [Rhodomicrobium sp.]